MEVSPCPKQPEALTARSLAFSYGLTIAFCLAVSVMLWLATVTSFSEGLIISLAIGLSINTLSVVGKSVLGRLVAPDIAQIPLQLTGLLIGLLVSAWLVTGNPWFYFAQAQVTVFLGLFFGVLAYLIFGTLSRLAESKAQLAQAHQLQAEQDRHLADTQLKLLQAQIEPHFLFNTLSNATSLIHSNPDAAETTLENLTLLLRQSLKRTRASDTTLGEELDMLNAYLNIAKVCMGERLDFKIEAPATIRDHALPPLLLQPLVENAVAHGLEPKADGGTIHISANVANEQLQLRVADTGLGMTGQSGTQSLATHNGTALTNIRERLQGLYGEQAKLRLRENAPTGVIAELVIPLGNT